MTKCSWWLSISTTFLFSIGLLMVFNTTSAEILDRSLDTATYSAFLKQIIYAFFGIFLGFLAYKIGYKNISKISYILLFIITVLLALVFIPPIGVELNGAKRWLNFFGFTFQPSELAKYFIPICFIHWSIRQKAIYFTKFCQILLLLGVPIFLIFLEPDNGTTGIIVFTLVVLFFLTKIRVIYWAIPLIAVSLVGGTLAFKMPHVRSRIQVYLHPELDLRGKGHQPYQAKIAAGSGGLMGKGLGGSLQKLNYLPEARSDYIAAIYAEEFGFIGVMAMIGIYTLIAFLGFFIAMKSKDKEAFLIASIITFLITFQAFLNLGVVSGLLPSKGTTLPFFSQGGSSLISNILAIGILLSVSKKKKKA
ncbi:MAG: putative lipid II flippase FtsW [Chlamydiae bacterium CG10_big_fil_rev_8_21_14_0_10_35_9]|nr:MAG: putative lipid II flippase FtsW [Chlamydiae bacterium CG10_big_fil_rev_8_21_14_0_10_35_9]